jgi:hypothetical protein
MCLNVNAWYSGYVILKNDSKKQNNIIFDPVILHYLA